MKTKKQIKKEWDETTRIHKEFYSQPCPEADKVVAELKLNRVSEEELKKRRIDVYDYIIK